MGNELEIRGQLFFLVGGTKGSLSPDFAHLLTPALAS